MGLMGRPDVQPGGFYRHVESGRRYRADRIVSDVTGHEAGRELRCYVEYTQVDDGTYPSGTPWVRDEQDFFEEFDPIDPATETVPLPIMTRTLQQEDIGYLIPILQAWVRNSDNGEILHTEIASIVSAMIASANGECDDRTYIVAESFTDGVVGVVGMRAPEQRMMPFVEKPNATVELINLFVRPDQRGTGVGRRLNIALEQAAFNHGATDVVVGSGPRYAESHSFYDAMGYKRKGVIESMYGLGRNAQVWRKTIVEDETRALQSPSLSTA